MSDYSIFLEVDGTKVHGFTAGRVMWRVDALCGVFLRKGDAAARTAPKTQLPSVVKLGAERTLGANPRWVKAPKAPLRWLMGR